MKYLKKFILKFFILFYRIYFLFFAFLLFGTQYGHNLRLTITESILTSQHPQYAKYTFFKHGGIKRIIRTY